MNMNDPQTVAPQAGASTEVFRQLGQITRQLHDTLTQLGVMPRLQRAAEGLPAARSRLSYIAQKTGEAADKVLNSVDRAKAEHSLVASETRRVAQAILKDPVKAVASGTVMNSPAGFPATSITGTGIMAPVTSSMYSVSVRWNRASAGTLSGTRSTPDVSTRSPVCQLRVRRKWSSILS